MEQMGIEPMSENITHNYSLRCLGCTDLLPPLCSTTTVYKEPLSSVCFQTSTPTNGISEYFGAALRLQLTFVCLRLFYFLMITSSHERNNYFHTSVETITAP